ncbi:4Fe-4S dicluster domain-containing protein [Desulfosarcina ovata]|uniref:4Fe-4S dicluster domain-containing protein n=1 Tax=Desulfosarcina ovata TaxID=83564 RepID=UPI0012D2B780|nr:4Fe-4S dicluster domain-containing protein [Desulfosarcina ovata]
MARYVMVVNLTLCMRCRACIVACKTEHDLPVRDAAGNECYRIRVHEYEYGNYPNVERPFAPVFCMQCKVASCIDACPIPGVINRGEDGIVVVDNDKCDGCKACLQACPYDALSFNHESHAVEKCDFCSERLSQNLRPACVASCMGKALTFGDIDDPESEVSRLMTKKGVKIIDSLFPSSFREKYQPCVYYINTVDP